MKRSFFLFIGFVVLALILSGIKVVEAAEDPETQVKDRIVKAEAYIKAGKKADARKVLDEASNIAMTIKKADKKTPDRIKMARYKITIADTYYKAGYSNLAHIELENTSGGPVSNLKIEDIAEKYNLYMIIADKYKMLGEKQNVHTELRHSSGAASFFIDPAQRAAAHMEIARKHYDIGEKANAQSELSMAQGDAGQIGDSTARKRTLDKVKELRNTYK
jgi:hypothetical protein